MYCGDEVDQYQPPPNVNQIKEMQKRTRSYNHSIVGLVCTPTVENGSIWQEYLKGSQGKWYLRCKGCGELTLDSSQISNLQFESEYVEELKTYRVKKGSCILACPKCGYHHHYEDCRWMNINGGWIHKFPDVLDSCASFQFGALASQLKSLCWDYIAQQQLDAGKSSDIEMQMSFDNSIRGLPWRPRKISKDEIERLRESHIWHISPSLENVELIFITSDTMDSFNSWAAWAWDVNDNLYMLECGEVPYIELSEDKRKDIDEQRKADNQEPVNTLEDILMRDWLVKDGVGIKATFLMIDQGGHKSNDVKHFCKMHKNVIMQKGTSMTSSNWKFSDNQERLVISNEKFWKSTAIYYLYSQKNKIENYLWFYPEISEDHIAEIRDMRPDDTSKFGHSPENWVSKTGKSHQFDCLKYAYLARDFALQTLMKGRYRFGQAPSILKRFEKQKKAEEAIQREQAKNSWFSI